MNVPTDTPIVPSQLSPVDILLVVVTFGLIVFLFFPTLSEIAYICWTDDDYSHGLLLPLVAGYMYWDSRAYIFKRMAAAEFAAQADPAKARVEQRWVLPELLLLSGLCIFFLGQASGISFTSWIGFFPTLTGALWLLFGRTGVACLAPPLLLLFMAKPLPDSFVVRLFWPFQVLAARVSKATLELFHVPVHLSGNIIEIPSMKLMVEEACSGMRSMMSLLTLAIIVIYFIELRVVSKLLLVAFSILTAVVLNVFRVALTGLLAHFYDPSTATGFFHTFSGMIVFIVGLPILYYFGNFLMRMEKRVTAAKKEP